MPVLVLAAGHGTRLRPLTAHLPKALVPVGDRPALAHVLERVRAGGGPVVVNAFHRREALVRHLEEHEPDVRVSTEDRLLGTAGGLRHAAPLLGGGDVLVWNADVLADVDAAEAVRDHDRTALATLLFEPRPQGEGNVGTDDEGRVVRLRRETVRGGETRGGLFLGIHVVGEELRRELPAEGCLVGDVYLPALRRGALLLARPRPAVQWTDVGTLADYLEANLRWSGAKSFVGGGTVVASGVTLDRAVIGRGAQVLGEGLLRRCVVWPHAVAQAPLEESLVGPWGVVAAKGAP